MSDREHFEEFTETRTLDHTTTMNHQTTTLTTQLAQGRENLQTNTRTQLPLWTARPVLLENRRDGQLMEFVDKIIFSETEWEVFYLYNMQKWILKLVINYHHALNHLIR